MNISRHPRRWRNRLGNPLKVETRVRTPLGLRRQTCRSRAKFGPTFATNQASPPRLIPQISRSTSEGAICAVGLMTPDSACDFALRPIPCRNAPSETRVSTCNGWRNATSITDFGSLDRTQFVADLVRTSCGGGPSSADPRAHAIAKCAIRSGSAGCPRPSTALSQAVSMCSSKAGSVRQCPCRRGRRRACRLLRSGNPHAARREWSSPWTGAPLRGQQEKVIPRILAWRQQPPRPTQPGPCRSS